MRRPTSPSGSTTWRRRCASRAGSTTRPPRSTRRSPSAAGASATTIRCSPTCSGTSARCATRRAILARAEPLLREALAIRRKAYGDDHPDTATSFNNLASLLHDAGDLTRAEPYYRLALASSERRLGTTASRLRRAAEQPGLAARRSGPGHRGRTAVQGLPGGAPHRPRARSSGRGPGVAQPGPRRTGARPRRSRRNAGRLGARPAPAGSCRPATSRSPRASACWASCDAGSSARRKPSSC